MPKFNKYGWRPDKPDKRDRYKTTHLDGSELPASVDLRPNMPPVYQQGELGMCTGTAIAADCHYQMVRQGGIVWQPSPMFIYYNERVIEGTINQDCGAEIRDGMKAINRWGVCAESLHPFVIADFKKKPSRQAYAEAAKHRVVDYARIAQSLTQLKASLAAGDPFVFGFTVYDSFESDTVTATGNMPMPHLNETMLGGHAVCFTKDTKVSLLNGSEVSFEELEKNYKDKSFWVYSWDGEKVVPGLAHSPRITRKNSEIIKITLDNNETIKCTYDHLFLMRDGNYKKANELVKDDSLMPLYRKKSNRKGMRGYELFLDVQSKKWLYTHREVAKYKNGKEYNSEVVHHVNFNKIDNTPEWAAKARQRIKENGKKVSEQLCVEGRCGFQAWDKEKLSEHGKIYGPENIKSAYTKEAQEKATSSRNKKLIENEEFRNEVKNRAITNINVYNKLYAEGAVDLTEKQIEARRKNGKALGQSRKQNNHKVIKIESGGFEDVYDLTVDKYHNFALSAGVFVHNCAVGFENNRNAFIIRNSWGASWGDNGYFYMPYEFIVDPDFAADFWTVKFIPV